MPSKQLKGTWAFFNVCLLAAGAVMIAFAVIWRAPNPEYNFIISEMDLNFGLVLGIFFLLTWAISVGAFIQPNHVTLGLVITNWALIVDSIGVLIMGTVVWYATLTPTKNYLLQWMNSPDSTKQMIQDSLNCCGYRNFTEFGLATGVCADPNTALTLPGCSTILLPFEDKTLNNIFSTVFGFMAVLIGFFLATVCLINKRLEKERFRKIDAKRGGHGFV